MAPSRYLIGLLLIVIASEASVNASESELQKLVNKFKEWLHEKVSGLEKEIQAAEAEFTTHYNSLLTREPQRIEKVVDNAVKDLKTWQSYYKKPCLDVGLLQLETAKKASIGEFFHCKNLTDAVLDVKNIIADTLNVTVEIFTFARDALQGLDQCTQENLYDRIKCVNDYIWDVINNIRQEIPDVDNYIADVKLLANKISDDISYCEKSHSKVNPIDHKVKTIINRIHLCSLKN